MAKMSQVIAGIFFILGGLFLSTNPDNSPYGVDLKMVAGFVLVGLIFILMGVSSSSPIPEEPTPKADVQVSNAPLEASMVLAICPKCKARISVRSKFCPECGEDVRTKTDDPN